MNVSSRMTKVEYLEESTVSFILTRIDESDEEALKVSVVDVRQK